MKRRDLLRGASATAALGVFGTVAADECCCGSGCPCSDMCPLCAECDDGTGFQRE